MKYLPIVLACVFLSCEQPDICFETVSGLKSSPTEIDTAVVFDPQTFEATCHITEFYRTRQEYADSTVTDGEMTISYTREDNCWRIANIRKPISCEGLVAQ